jgi:hypothetical protein
MVVMEPVMVERKSAMVVVEPVMVERKGAMVVMEPVMVEAVVSEAVMPDRAVKSHVSAAAATGQHGVGLNAVPERHGRGVIAPLEWDQVAGPGSVG